MNSIKFSHMVFFLGHSIEIYSTLRSAYWLRLLQWPKKKDRVYTIGYIRRILTLEWTTDVVGRVHVGVI